MRRFTAPIAFQQDTNGSQFFITVAKTSWCAYNAAALRPARC